jgi:hypothetical protein
MTDSLFRTFETKEKQKERKVSRSILFQCWNYSIFEGFHAGGGRETAESFPFRVVCC